MSEKLESLKKIRDGMNSVCEKLNQLIATFNEIGEAQKFDFAPIIKNCQSEIEQYSQSVEMLDSFIPLLEKMEVIDQKTRA